MFPRQRALASGLCTKEINQNQPCANLEAKLPLHEQKTQSSLSGPISCHRNSSDRRRNCIPCLHDVSFIGVSLFYLKRSITTFTFTEVAGPSLPPFFVCLFPRFPIFTKKQFDWVYLIYIIPSIFKCDTF